MKPLIPIFTENVHLSEDGAAVEILDQTRLPNEEVTLTLRNREELFEAIASLRVRGAPAIGIFAAYAIYILSNQTKCRDYESFCREFRANKDYLDSSRPTAVNLRKALDRMEGVVLAGRDKPVEDIVAGLRREALAIHQEDIEMCLAIATFGLELVKDGDGVLTHCNAGALATSRYGTGLGTLLLAKELGINLRAYVDETRPLLQGARLTTYELMKAGVDCTLICDNMAAQVMKEGKVQAVFVGCDRVAANGDTANKIGTSGLAILARHYNIPFYVFCPSSTVDLNCRTGEDITIELRDPKEITELYFYMPVAPRGVRCYNPACDLTDRAHLPGIVTEKGILRPPFEEGLRRLFGEGGR